MSIASTTGRFLFQIIVGVHCFQDALFGFDATGVHVSNARHVDPDAGIVINWTALDTIVSTYIPTDSSGWLPPAALNCSGVLNLNGLHHDVYRPLFCPWFLKPFRDPFDLVVTESEKWPVYKKLMGATNVSVGLPVLGFFGTCVCRVYANSTQAYKALAQFDSCWYEHDELQKCMKNGHRIPLRSTNLTARQYEMLLRNASYADQATPHL